MDTRRLIAFCDAVIAIIMTIMVLDVHPPEGNTFKALLDIKMNLIVYVISFIFIAIYWVNHHHLMSVATKVTTKLLWFNLLFLFFLSLVPFATQWVAETHFASDPVAFYGIIFLSISVTYGNIQTHIEKVVFKTRSILFIQENIKVFISNVFHLVGIFIAMKTNEVVIPLALYSLSIFFWHEPNQIYVLYHDNLKMNKVMTRDELISIIHNKKRKKIWLSLFWLIIIVIVWAIIF